MSDEDALTNFENELKGSMPEECYNGYKKFVACKNKFDEQLLAEKGYQAFQDFYKEPLSRTAGCKNEFDAYVKCQTDFFWRYIDLKNYVAEIEGLPLPYNKKAMKLDMKKNLTAHNIGLNKF